MFPKWGEKTLIALAVSMAFCKEPAYLHNDNLKLWPHLLKCLINGVLAEFPSKQEPRSLFIEDHTVPLYCSCRMPGKDLIFQCTKCQCWFHLDCQEIKLNARYLKHSKKLSNV